MKNLSFGESSCIAAASGLVEVRGARENNLQDVDVSIPRNALVVFSGGTQGADPIGLALACGSGVIYAGIFIASARVLQALPSAAATAFQTSGLGVAWLVASVVMGVQFQLPGLSGLQWLIVIVVFCASSLSVWACCRHSRRACSVTSSPS